MRHVVFHYQASPVLTRRLAALAESDGILVDIVVPDDQPALRAVQPRCEALWHVLEPVTAAFIEACPKLRLIQKIGVGVNTINLDAARTRGIAVCNMPGTNSRAVAEMTLALMLACLRRLIPLDAAVRGGAGWQRPAAEMDQFGEIGGRRVGLAGMGAVPRLLAPVLTALGAEIVYWTRAPKPELPYRWLPFEELLAASDVLSLHLPLTAETEKLLDAAAFRRLKPGAILINTARGGLVDEAALLAALENGHLAGAGLDVFAEEPVARDNPLLRQERVVLAPHLAWLTPETLERSIGVAVENVRRLGAGEPLLHQVA
jgi:phosphoglycerate dehydrogenase-like enzyme